MAVSDLGRLLAMEEAPSQPRTPQLPFTAERETQSQQLKESINSSEDLVFRKILKIQDAVMIKLGSR